MKGPWMRESCTAAPLYKTDTGWVNVHPGFVARIATHCGTAPIKEACAAFSSAEASIKRVNPDHLRVLSHNSIPAWL
jgi:hypothetical protein